MPGLLAEQINVVAAETPWLTVRALSFIALIISALGIASIVGLLLSRRESMGVDMALVGRYNRTLRVWWLMIGIFFLGFLFQRIGVVALFAFVSFWALREFITMTPTRRGDHRTLFWVFFVFTPFQYILIGLGDAYYDFYSIMIPVYASLFIPARTAMAGDSKRFLERCAKIQAALLICVYALSHAPALLSLNLVSTGGEPWNRSPMTLIIFLVVIAQLSTALERGWSKLAGRHVIAEKINASRTWEGVLGSMVTTGLIAAALSWATPFYPWEAGVMAAVVTAMACGGVMTMSAIKRDRGVKDTGTLVQGHAGVLDQIDNICFAAPVFYHLTRYFFSVQ